MLRGNDSDKRSTRESAPAIDMAASNSLERALIILELIDRTPGGLTNSDICHALNMATSSCTYVLSRLEKRGYLSRDHNGRYRMGLTPLMLAHGALRDLSFRSVDEPALYRLVNDTGLAATVGVIERGQVLVVDRIESPRLAHDTTDISSTVAASRHVRQRELRDLGREMPLHSNAMGKAILAFLPRDTALSIIDEHGLARCTKRTITSRSKLLNELEVIRERGFAISCQEQYDGICGIGAPIVDATGTVRGAVSLNGTKEESRSEDVDRFSTAVKVAAHAISTRGRFRNTARPIG